MRRGCVDGGVEGNSVAVLVCLYVAEKAGKGNSQVMLCRKEN